MKDALVCACLVGLAVGGLFGCRDTSRTGAAAPDVGCEIGATRREGCNVCQCTKEQGWVCTVRLCGDATVDLGLPSDLGPPPPEDAAVRDVRGEPRDGGADGSDARDVSEVRDTSEPSDTPDRDGSDADTVMAPGDGGEDAVPARDARDASRDGASALDDSGLDVGDGQRAMFGCISTQCQSGTEYCRVVQSGAPPPRDAGVRRPPHRCESYGSCGPNPDCSCLESIETPPQDAVTASCDHPRDGVFFVYVHVP